MAGNRFVGRKRELKKLEELYATEEFQMAVFYGRRRVGKTTLINEFCKGKKTIFCVGIESTEKENLESFSKEVWRSMEQGIEMPAFKDFESLFDYIAKLSEKERMVLVIDEYPYLASASPAVSSILQACIDRKMKDGKLFLILCGSSMSFMEHQVLGYKSPLYGRRTAQFKILPFDYWEAKEMLPGFQEEEQALLYGITGGIPEYLYRIRQDWSVEQNLVDLFFDSSGRLFEEPSNLLKQELRDPSTYNAILTAIAEGHSKLNEIASTVGIASGGCSNLLTSLSELGIITKETPVAETSAKKTIYKITDQMFRFWYRFVGPNTNTITAGYGEQVFQRLVAEQLSDFMGQVFEKMCLDWMVIQQGEGSLPIFFSQIGHWWGGNPKTRKQEEIDIMAVEKSSAIFGECKWRNEPIDKAVLDKMIVKAEMFHYEKKYIYLFSKSGFTQGCKERAEECKNVRLIAFREMVKTLKKASTS